MKHSWHEEEKARGGGLLFFDSLKVGKFSKKWIVVKKIASNNIFFANGNFSAAAPPFGAYSDWFSLKSSKQENKRRNLTSKNSVFLYEISLFGYAIDHQISKAWIQSAGLSSKYLWVVCWVNAGDIGKEKWPEFAIWYPLTRPSNIAHPFYMKKGSSDSVLPFLCMYVCLLAVLTLMKGQRLCITWTPNVTPSFFWYRYEVLCNTRSRQFQMVSIWCGRNRFLLLNFC